MKNKLSLILACSLLNACSLADMAEKKFEQNLTSLLGKPLDNAISSLGMPNNEGVIAGQKFYLWSNAGVAVIPHTAVTDGSGAVGTTPFNYSQTTYGGGQAVPTHCTIRLFMKNDIVHSWDIDSSGPISCLGYMGRLNEAKMKADKKAKKNEDTPQATKKESDE